VEWAEPIAYGPLELKPWEFEQLQPHEFYKLYEGFVWRQEQQEALAAYFVSHLMNISGKVAKRTIQPKDLLKPLRQASKQRDKKVDEEYLKDIFKDSLQKGGI